MTGLYLLLALVVLLLAANVGVLLVWLRRKAAVWHEMAEFTGEVRELLPVVKGWAAVGVDHRAKAADALDKVQTAAAVVEQAASTVAETAAALPKPLPGGKRATDPPSGYKLPPIPRPADDPPPDAFKG